MEALMSGSLFWLSDEAWAAIEPKLPRNQPGARRTDDRRIISGIIHMLKCGGRWQDVPAAYGPPTTVYNRWHRWSGRGVLRKLLEALAGQGAVDDLGYLDSTYVKAQRSAQGGKGGRRLRRLASLAADRPPKSTPFAISWADLSPLPSRRAIVRTSAPPKG